MIILHKKNIHRWAYWREKSKILFCIASGLVYTSVSFLGALSSNLLAHREDAVQTSLTVALVVFVVSGFLSIALWYENERRYTECLKACEEK